MDIYIISAQYFKENSIVTDNLEEQYVNPSILDAQSNMLPSILCRPLYDYLFEKLNEYAIAKEADHTEVLSNFLDPKHIELIEEYIKPILIDYTLFYVASYNILRYNNKGTTQFDAENVTSANLRAMSRTKQLHKINAEAKATTLRRWILANIDSFEKYKDCKCDKVINAKHIINMY